MLGAWPIDSADLRDR